MNDPSKEENNNCCSNQGIDAVVNNNTQEETSLLVTLCDAAAVIISISELMRYNVASIGNPQQSSAYACIPPSTTAAAYNHFYHLGQLYKLTIRMVQSTNCFSVLEQFR